MSLGAVLLNSGISTCIGRNVCSVRTSVNRELHLILPPATDTALRVALRAYRRTIGSAVFGVFQVVGPIVVTGTKDKKVWIQK